jgi:predicted adenylyl cyclase CyaB
MIEVEMRSFITKEQHDRLLKFFMEEGDSHTYDDQETHYFDAPVDIRIQKGAGRAKVWMKIGKMHAEEREEIEVAFDRADFAKLQRMFLLMGYGVKVKWFRKRHTFTWNGLDVCVDSNKGYGYILEVEKMTDDAGRKEALRQVSAAFSELGIAVTPKEEFDEKYRHYLQNWKELTK